jgi:hypothetical protein
MNMLKELLSAAGYKKAIEIMGSDQILADQGADFQAGNDNYLVAIFGTPNLAQLRGWLNLAGIISHLISLLQDHRVH